MALDYMFSANPNINNALSLRLQRGRNSNALKFAQAAGDIGASANELGRSGTAYEGSFLGQAKNEQTRGDLDLESGLASEGAAIDTEDRRLQEARQYGTSERVAGQDFTRSFTNEREEAARKYGTSERLGSQEFSRGERTGSQDYTAAQNLLARQYGTSERLGSQEFESGEGLKSREFTALESLLGRQFAEKQSSLDKIQELEVQTRNHQYGPSGPRSASPDYSGYASAAAQAAITAIILCFSGETLVKMADGSEKKIKDIVLGDVTLGGVVQSVRQSLGNGIYDYNGVMVTGSHAVKEDGMWIRVAESPMAIKRDFQETTYSLITDKHRIFVGDIEFADEAEEDAMWSDKELNSSLERLNTVGAEA